MSERRRQVETCSDAHCAETAMKISQVVRLLNSNMDTKCTELHAHAEYKGKRAKQVGDG